MAVRGSRADLEGDDPEQVPPPKAATGGDHDRLYRILGQAWLAIAVHLWQTSLVLAVVFVLARWLRSAPAGTLNQMWSLAFLKIVLPLSILGPIAQRVSDLFGLRFGAGPGDRAWQMPATLQVLIDPSATVATGGQASIDWARWVPVILTAVWLVLFGVRAYRLARDILDSRRQAGSSMGDLSVREQEKITQALHHADISSEDLQFLPTGSLPHTIGFFHPRILIPRKLIRALGVTELRAVILHEEAHRKRRDPLRRLLQRMVGCFLFFYPPLWAVDRRLGEAVELVCDERVSTYGVGRETFARALSKTIRFGLASNLSPLSAGVGGASTLRLRIQRISTPGRFSMLNRHRLVLCFVVLLIAFTTLLPVPLRADDTEEAPETAAAVDKEKDKDKEKAEQEEFPEVEKMPKMIEGTFGEVVYPEEEKKAGIEGMVMLRVQVTAEGTVGELLAVEEVEDHPAFTESAIAAARTARFEPAEADGKPVACWVQIPLKFRLDGGEVRRIKRVREVRRAGGDGRALIRPRF